MSSTKFLPQSTINGYRQKQDPLAEIISGQARRKSIAEDRIQTNQTSLQHLRRSSRDSFNDVFLRRRNRNITINLSKLGTEISREVNHQRNQINRRAIPNWGNYPHKAKMKDEKNTRRVNLSNFSLPKFSEAENGACTKNRSSRVFVDVFLRRAKAAMKYIIILTINKIPNHHT